MVILPFGLVPSCDISKIDGVQWTHSCEEVQAMLQIAAAAVEAQRM